MGEGAALGGRVRRVSFAVFCGVQIAIFGKAVIA